MILQRVCVELTCDTAGCEDPWGDEGTPHFTSDREAITHATAEGWTFTGGIARCSNCTDRHVCLTSGHRWRPWETGQIKASTHRRRWCERCSDMEYNPPLPEVRALIAAARPR
ncbi:hypothetical protein V1634_27015 [Plantactinospora veratri]|uniref:Uncharacterized protein n=1 Tax=Plantactinospora veratri TaxID=1436122 RepID=A0ABU7SKJ3_9ACTN